MIRLVAQGRLIEATEKLDRHSKRPPPLRKAITEFSKASRRRLLKMFARLNPAFKGRKTFITLTFSGIPTPVDAKAALKRFLMRFTRRFPKACGIWRMEFQDRGSIHFHFIFFNLPFIPQRGLQETWEECTREERSIVDIRLIRTMRGVMSYCSKYIAKLPQTSENTSLDGASYQHGEGEPSFGRFWGYWHGDALPFGTELRGYITNEALVRRWRRWMRVKSGGRAGEWGAGGCIYDDDALRMFDMWMMMGGWGDSEWEEFQQTGVLPRSTVVL